MFIVNQDREKIVNVDHVVRIFVENDVRVMAETSGGESIILGMYLKRENKAHDVFAEMLQTVFKSLVVLKDCTFPSEDMEKTLKNVTLYLSKKVGELKASTVTILPILCQMNKTKK